MIQDVYIIGSKGIPAHYGGYETFVEKLTAGRINADIHYHVAARSDNSERGNERTFSHNGAEVFNVHVPNIGSAQAILYDVQSLRWAIKDAEVRHSVRPIFYILACRIGPFMSHFTKLIHNIGGRYFINPDGHEWKRAKWSAPVRWYWKQSERLMIKHADLVVCDNRKIEEYIQTEYLMFNPRTTFIAYGTDVEPSGLTDKDSQVKDWYAKTGLLPNNYYLIVGRFVPENNYVTMITEFMKSETSRQLAIITNVQQNKFYKRLMKETGFPKDNRIKFVGTVYDQALLKFIRENAYGYIHGHEVGGTNPSLLEALSTTKLNLLIDVGFNRDVAHDAAMYWSKNTGNLSKLIDACDNLRNAQITKLHQSALNIIYSEYTCLYRNTS